MIVLKVSLGTSLDSFLKDGQRKIERWSGSLRAAQVLFHNQDEFINANTLEDLAHLGHSNDPHERPR